MLSRWSSQSLGLSLNLDFLSGGALDPRISFSRPSTATRINSAGLLESVASGAPRIDYDPVTLACRGLLVEEQRTNLLLRSAELDSAWTVYGGAAVTANQAVSPDGATTADLLNLTTGGIYQIVSGSPSTAYTFSVWLRAAAPTTARIVINTNLSDATTQAVAVTTTWQRFAVTKTTAVGTTSVTAQIDNGAGAAVVYAWGAQLEAGAFASSYIPTAGAQATRAADVPPLPLGAWFNPAEGAVVVEYDSLATTGFPDVFNVSDGTNANRLQQYIDGSNGFTSFREVVSGVVQGLASDSTTQGSVVRSAVAYSSAGVVLCVNAKTPVTTANANHAAGLNKLTLGCSPAGTASFLNGHIRRLRYYRTRLSNAQLQALTA